MLISISHPLQDCYLWLHVAHTPFHKTKFNLKSYVCRDTVQRRLFCLPIRWTMTVVLASVTDEVHEQ